MRELGRRAETAVTRVETRRQILERQVNGAAGELRMVRRVRGLHALEAAEYGLALPGDFRSIGVIELRHAQEQIGKSGQTVARRLGEISAAEKRLLLGREKHGERPAARALAHHLVRQLVDLVQVWTLLAVDLDVDEMPVHQ